jgi:hypothetical protein
MLEKYEEIGSTEDDLKMSQIIKDNQIKTRMLINERNKKNKLKAKWNRFENSMIYVIFGILASGAFLGLMFLIAVIENLKF